MALVSPATARRAAANRVANRLIAAYKAKHLTRGQALTECSKVIDTDVGFRAWKLFRKGIK